jgi:hypothetical protein
MKTSPSLTIFFLLTFSLFRSIPLPAQTFYNVESIDINNINANVGVHGDLWHSWNNGQITAGCEYPKGSGKHLAIAGGLWMGGYDQSGNLRTSATLYRQAGEEYWPGPLQGTDTVITYLESQKWARIWKIKRSDIQLFLNTANHTLTNTPTNILEWPAKGNPYAKGNNNTSLNITANMAPFIDVNSDGSYDPLSGDYPEMKGDEMLWFVFNDHGPTHNEIPGSLPMGIQVKASVYGFENASVPANVLYYEFELLNKQQTLDSFVLGTFADLDLGYSGDDYIGFDSFRDWPSPTMAI